MKRYPLVLAMCLALLTGLALNATAENALVREFNKSVALRSGGEVKIENVFGPITVSGWDKEVVQVSALLTLNSEITGEQVQKYLDAVEIEVEHGWNRVDIRSKYSDGDLPSDEDDDNEIKISLDINLDDDDDDDEHGGFIDRIMGIVGKMASGVSGWATEYAQKKMPVEVSYQVMVPSQCRLDVKTVTGDLLISGVEGEFEAGLVTGNISLANVAGKLDCGVVTGNVEIDGADGFIEASVITGSVLIGFAEDSRFDGVECNVVNGDILVRVPDDTAMDLNLKAVNGKISFETDNLSGKMVHGTSYVGSVGGGGPEMDIKAINGSIRLERVVQ